MPSSDINSFHLIAVGQTLLHTNFQQLNPSGYRSALQYLCGADIVFTVFESAIEVDNMGARTRLPHQTFHASPTESLDTLQDMGFNLLAVGGNHTWDLGTDGIVAGIKELKKRQFTFAGMGMDIFEATAPAYINTQHGKVALISMATGKLLGDAPATPKRPGVNELRVSADKKINPDDAGRVLNSIQEATKWAKYVIISHHNHEWEQNISVTPNWQKEWAHACIESGASIYISHGAPLLHGIELYQGHPIFYNLGNYIFQTVKTIGWQEEVWDGILADCFFNKDGNLTSLKLRPLLLKSEGKSGLNSPLNRGFPTLAKGLDALRILEYLSERSRSEYGTELIINEDCAELRER